MKPMPHDFARSLAASHAAEDLPLWREVYAKAFPSMRALINHRQDGEHQRAGIDRSVILANSKQILIDEKVRGRNAITGKVYEDIALEYLSDRARGIAGWVCKPLRSDYIAYAIAPLGRCYLLPVEALQNAWARSKDLWLKSYRKIEAINRYRGHEWVTVSLAVPVDALFRAMGQCLRIEFTPIDWEEGKPHLAEGENDDDSKWWADYERVELP